ncbi:hypothetical protein CFC21_003360 [Triticum aestivum]|uniref:Uncharacterized protein n=2 Tax=Triticum TaxID=4564 RepID=A0A9R0QEI1_TRITD|nr:hypothetical protein CFC21_003360 [Triticum aestivum]VAH09090.1 unnamed protein product [Triticum turgidum subsp. durum]
MDTEPMRCTCCDFKEECTQEYIKSVKANFGGEWLCGLCSEAVGDELSREGRGQDGVKEAIKVHMAFCRMALSSPAVRVADGMREMLRRSSRDKGRPSTSAKSCSL